MRIRVEWNVVLALRSTWGVRRLRLTRMTGTDDVVWFEIAALVVLTAACLIGGVGMLRRAARPRAG